MTTMVIPDRSLEQRMDGLRLANEVRSRRARLKRDIKAGRVDVRAVLADPADWQESMRVRDLLAVVPALGPVKVAKLMDRARIAPAKTLGGITERQRGELLTRLDAYAGWRRASGSHRQPDEQAREALALANTIRIERSRLRRSVADLAPVEGRARLAELLADPPECMRSAIVIDVLAWPHRLGDQLSLRMLRRLAIGPDRTVADLTARQRGALSELLTPSKRERTPAPLPRAAPRSMARPPLPAVAKPKRRPGMSGPQLRERLHGMIALAAGVTEQQLTELSGADRDEVAFQVGTLLLERWVRLQPDGRYVASSRRGSPAAGGARPDPNPSEHSSISREETVRAA